MKLVLSIFIFLVAFSVSAQSKRMYVYHGDEYFKKLDYANAITQYKLVFSDSVALNTLIFPYEIQISNQKLPKDEVQVDSTLTVPLEKYLDHQIAWCYMELRDYTNAESHLRKTADENMYPHDRFYFAQSLMKNAKYDSAIVEFENYIRSPRASVEYLNAAKVDITGCYLAQKEQGLVHLTRVSLADSLVFNNSTSSFGAMQFGSDDRIMFAAAREGGVIFDETQQSEFLLDLYWTERQSDSTWAPAKNFGRPLNSAQHDAAAAFNPSTNVIYYTRWNDEKRDEQNIHLIRMRNFKFYESFKLDSTVNCTGCRSIQPFVSMDGQTLFFSSNRPGGFGGMDIWKIALDSTGLPKGQPVNLGILVNSDRDEITPFFHEVTSTLFFASDGHGSMGGFDNFKSTYDREADGYSTPENMGMPINSEMDDAYLIWDTQLKTGFFSSDREPCEGGHCYDIYEVRNEPIYIYLSGYSYDKDSYEILPNCKLTFKDIRGKFEPFYLTTDENGYYSLELKFSTELFIKCQKEDYFADATDVNTKTITETTYLTRDFYLQPIPKDEIEIEGIEYDFDSDKLRPISMEKLDVLYDFLELNNNLAVEINSHTDARGRDSYNLDLSKRRAKSCVDYLISKGIDPERLIPIGYGETSPNKLFDSTTKKEILDENGNSILLTEEFINSQESKERQEEYHQRNRRTSFKVINSTLKEGGE